jgi:hypothetical protein
LSVLILNIIFSIKFVSTVKKFYKLILNVILKALINWKIIQFDGRLVVGILAYYARGHGFDFRTMQTFV